MVLGAAVLSNEGGSFGRPIGDWRGIGRILYQGATGPPEVRPRGFHRLLCQAIYPSNNNLRPLTIKCFPHWVVGTEGCQVQQATIV